MRGGELGRLLERLAVGRQLERARHVAVARELAPDQVGHLGMLLQRVQRERRRVALGHVRARRLAQRRRRARQVEHVVDDLVGKPEVAAVRRERGAHLGRVPAQHRARLAREADERGRLAVRLVQVVVPVEQRLARLGRLHQLARHHLVDDLRHQPHHLVVAQPREQHRRARKQKVAAEHSRLGAVELVHRRLAAPRVRTVNHVIVHQRRHVDHLDNLCEPLLRCACRLTAVGSGRRQQHYRRSERLSGLLEEVLGRLGQHGLLARDEADHRLLQWLQRWLDELKGIWQSGPRAQLDVHGRVTTLVVWHWLRQ